MKTQLHRNAIFKKSLKKMLSFILALSLTLSMFSGLPLTAMAADNSGVANKDKAVYVALGDSVPAGYGLTNTNDCYVNQFSDKMNKNGYSNTMYNYAVSGATTQDLLSALKNMKTDYPDSLKQIKKAGVITVNIGGNNVLGPFVKAVNDTLSQQLEELGITNLADADESQLIKLGFALSSMKLSNTKLEEIQKGAKTFADDFPTIIKWLQTNAPDANIIVSTIYNPIPSLLNFYDTAESLLKEMNSVITDGAAKGGYSVADVYTAFVKEQNNGTQILNLNIGQYQDSPISIDIHPNAAGHKLIAKLHNEIFNSIPSIVKTSSGSPVTAKISLSGKVDKNGTLTANITKTLLKKVIKKAQDHAKLSGRTKDGIAVIFENSNKEAKNIKVNIEASAIDLLVSSGVKKISVNTKILCISLDKDAVKKIVSKTNRNVTFTANKATKLSKTAKALIGTRPVYQISIIDTSKKKISDLGKGKLFLSILYYARTNENTNQLIAVTVNSKGQAKKLAGSKFSNGWLNYSGNIISFCGVGYKK